jgi:hypothetical protein
LAPYPSDARVGLQNRPAAAALVLAVAVIATGCGGGGSSSTTTTPTGPKETAQKLPKLPPGWRAHRDTKVGYAIGLPPGWKATSQRRSVLFRSPDHLVAVTLAANRDPAVFDVTPDKFASQALGGLPGFKVPLNPGKVKSFAGTPLKAVQTSASASQARGIKESATLVVLRRDHLTNYTVAVLANAQQPGADVDRAVALRMIQTLRDVPVKGSENP